MADQYPIKSLFPIKICFVCKYPPIEGGVSSRCYWLARGLAARGCEVHVVTNAWQVEDDFRECIPAIEVQRSDYQPPGVTVHNIDFPVDNSRHFIPFSNAYTEKIANLALQVIEDHGVQVIDSWYIVPYVIAGFIAKVLSGKPQLMRHAGSDIGSLFLSSDYRSLFSSLFKQMDRVITYPNHIDNFAQLGVSRKKIFLVKPCVDTSAFHPNVVPLDLSQYTDQNIEGIPLITYVGKLGEGRDKGVYELVEAASRIQRDFRLLLVTKGKALALYKETIASFGMQEKVIFIDFLPPWKMPSLIKRSSCVVAAERDYSIAFHSPILPREVMAVGKCVIISEEIYNKYKTGFGFENEKNVLVVNPKDIDQFTRTLDRVIGCPEYTEAVGQQAAACALAHEHFDEYIERTLGIYCDLLG